jgi:RecA/RadA recombinase
LAELKIKRMSEIQALPVSWLWEPYIPRGKITIVQGDPGDGKTTMMLAIAAAVTNGEPLPNGFADIPSDVIFQTAEDGLADTIKPRLEQLGADCLRIHVIDEDEQSLSLSDERIEQAIVETNAKLLIIDPIQAYLGGADMHSAKGMRPLMKSLGAAAERTGCAVVIIGHLNKRSFGTKAQYRGLGSIDIYAATRSVLTVGKVNSGENMRAVVHNKSNLAPLGASMSFVLDPVFGFSWQGEYDINVDDLFNNAKNSNESQFDRAKRLIESVLRDGAVAAEDIMQMAENEGISVKTLKRAKAALGVISKKRGEQWFWEMTETIYTEFTEKQEGQEGHTRALTSLPLFNQTR